MCANIESAYSCFRIPFPDLLVNIMACVHAYMSICVCTLCMCVHVCRWKLSNTNSSCCACYTHVLEVLMHILDVTCSGN